jgi:hypothetical protein
VRKVYYSTVQDLLGKTVGEKMLFRWNAVISTELNFRLAKLSFSSNRASARWGSRPPFCQSPVLDDA